MLAGWERRAHKEAAGSMDPAVRQMAS